MKKLINIKGAKVLSKNEQKGIKGGGEGGHICGVPRYNCRSVCHVFSQPGWCWNGHCQLTYPLGCIEEH